jgi:hypothetical protein
MSEVQTTDFNTPPPCPVCEGITKLKEMRKLENQLHYFFKCIDCAVEYPVIHTNGKR